jgi:hypothetical protein
MSFRLSSVALVAAFSSCFLACVAAPRGTARDALAIDGVDAGGKNKLRDLERESNESSLLKAGQMRDERVSAGDYSVGFMPVGEPGSEHGVSRALSVAASEQGALQQLAAGVGLAREGSVASGEDR